MPISSWTQIETGKSEWDLYEGNQGDPKQKGSIYSRSFKDELTSLYGRKALKEKENQEEGVKGNWEGNQQWRLWGFDVMESVLCYGKWNSDLSDSCTLFLTLFLVQNNRPMFCSNNFDWYRFILSYECTIIAVNLFDGFKLYKGDCHTCVFWCWLQTPVSYRHLYNICLDVNRSLYIHDAWTPLSFARVYMFNYAILTMRLRLSPWGLCYV